MKDINWLRKHLHYCQKFTDQQILPQTIVDINIHIARINKNGEPRSNMLTKLGINNGSLQLKKNTTLSISCSNRKTRSLKKNKSKTVLTSKTMPSTEEKE